MVSFYFIMFAVPVLIIGLAFWLSNNIKLRDRDG